MKFYPESFVARLIFCIVSTAAAINLGLFVRSLIINEPFAFNVVRCLLIPLALGVFTAFMWKKPEGK